MASASPLTTDPDEEARLEPPLTLTYSTRWVRGRVPRADLDECLPQDLLRRGALELPENWRYSIDSQGVSQIGDARISDDTDDPLSDAERTLKADLVERPTAAPDAHLQEALISSLLDESGLPFHRRESGWVLGPERRHAEITVVGAAGGVRIESVLAAWDDMDERSIDAIALLCCRTHGRLRRARCLLNDHDARITCFTPTSTLETDLVENVQAAMEGVACLRRSVRALAEQRLADAYLDEHARPARELDAERHSFR